MHFKCSLGGKLQLSLNHFKTKLFIFFSVSYFIFAYFGWNLTNVTYNSKVVYMPDFMDLSIFIQSTKFNN